MGEFSASDCSWKKMVIAKANDKWISTIKSEQNDVNDTVSVTAFSVSDQYSQYANIKREREDIPDEQVPQNIQHTPDGPEILMIQDADPLLVMNDVPSKRRRKSSTAGFKNESPEERSARLAKMSAYAAQRLANETPEQRALRLRRMSEYAAKRLAQETSEQRAKRLARMSAYAARRLAKETPEQRQARLARMSAYAARRHALKKAGGSSSSDVSVAMSFYEQIASNMPDQS